LDLPDRSFGRDGRRYTVLAERHYWISTSVTL
jgi:hypothetical protein